MRKHRFVDSDETRPIEIEHQCEELYVGEELEQEYNCIVYHFESSGAYFWARARTDEIQTVSVYGPFENRRAMNRIPGRPDEGMLSYLKRRFRKIPALANDGYVEIWSR